MEDCKDWIDPENAEMLLKFVAKSLHARAGNASIHESQGIAAPQGSRPAHRTIQKLVINIPVDPDAGHSREAQDIHQVSSKNVRCMIPSGKRAALVFASSLHEQLLRIFDNVLKFCHDNSFRTRIFECVGAIDLNVDGRLFRRLNLSQIFANLPCDEQWFGFGFSRVEFFEWKRAAEDKRKAAGFELVRPSVQEHELAGSAGLIASILAARDESLGREVILPSDDDTPSARQPETHEQFFIGNALLVQENGSMVAGEATFYYSDLFIWMNTLQYVRPPATFPPLHHDQPDPSFSELSYARKVFNKQALGDRPREREVVLFEGETILFSGVDYYETITSGDATFYGRAETASTERSSSTKAVFQDARDHHDASDI
ncbi:hypothetical protein F5883DRAFT_635883 [Diaporthe sp. PMI_573]|nr:hypothetical protein F5883DRAFT_635883 [Diaporthaceae sp. PMI_573]